MDCLQEWGDFMRLGIPGMLMLSAEWWTYELGAFLAGKMYAKASALKEIIMLSLVMSPGHLYVTFKYNIHPAVFFTACILHGRFDK